MMHVLLSLCRGVYVLLMMANQQTTTENAVPQRKPSREHQNDTVPVFN